MKLEKNSYAIQIVNKAFEMLEILSDQSEPSDLPHLAAKIAMTRNKTFRLLATLCENGLVERDLKQGNYQLGFNSVSLAQKMLRHSNVVNLSHPIMEDLARKHHEAVYMTVIRGDEVLFLDMVDCEEQIKATSMVGKKFPFFTNAAGKAIKAMSSTDMIERLGKRRANMNAIPDMDKLEMELRTIRQSGVAIDFGGLGEGISSVAVVVKDYAGKVIGAVTVLAPSFRMLRERIENEIVPSLIEGAARISKNFGYIPTEEFV